MRNLIAFAAATTLLTASAAFAQSAMPSSSAHSSAGMSMQGQTPKSANGDAMMGKSAGGDAMMDKSADASAQPAKKSRHRMARNESAKNASEAEVTKQLNQEQSGMGKDGAGTP